MGWAHGRVVVESEIGVELDLDVTLLTALFWPWSNLILVLVVFYSKLASHAG